MNKSYISFYYLQFFYCYTTFQILVLINLIKLYIYKSYKVIFKNTNNDIINLAIIMKFLLQYSTSKVFLKMLLAMIKGVLESKQFLSPKMLKNLF